MKSKTLFALVTGIAAGAVLGALFAPEKGELTRSKIRKMAAEEFDKFRSSLDKEEEQEPAPEEEEEDE